MKRSRYNYFLKVNEEYYVFNTFSGSICLLSDEEYCVYSDVNQELERLDIECLEDAKRMGILLEDDIDELNIVTFDHKYYSISAAPYFRILPTTACNAKCYYCYEKGTKAKTMSFSTMQDTVRFITSRVQPHLDFKMEWFGGEPLLNTGAIDFISHSLFEKGYQPARITMVTNGLLINSEIAQKMKEDWKISAVQITLDGPEDIYNKVKFVNSIKNPFQTVLKNIILLADNEIDVIIRMNVDKNEDQLKELLLILKEKFKNKRNISYYFYPMFEASHSVSNYKIQQIIRLNHELIEMGLMKAENLYGFEYHCCSCYATCFHGYTIAPDGKLYNCTHNMNENGSVGDICSYNPYHHNRLRFLNVSLSDECINCLFLPLCQGGCRMGELKGSNMHQCYLYKNGIDEAIKERIIEGGD